MIIVSLITVSFIGKRNWRLSIAEISIVWFAGLIRGSIAYALIVSISDEKEGADLIKTTVLVMVILTTIILGAFMPLYINLHLKNKDTSLMKSTVYRETLPVRETLIGVK